MGIEVHSAHQTFHQSKFLKGVISKFMYIFSPMTVGKQSWQGGGRVDCLLGLVSFVPNLGPKLHKIKHRLNNRGVGEDTAFKIREPRAANPFQLKISKLYDLHFCLPTHYPKHPAINQLTSPSSKQDKRLRGLEKRSQSVDSHNKPAHSLGYQEGKLVFYFVQGRGKK